MTGALPVDVIVELAFGYRPGHSGAMVWTPVSDYVALHAGDLTISPGRTPDSPGIAPRSLSLVFDNRDGRFNPRNTTGPYYGDLVPRVPIRVRTVDSGATSRTLFRGYVDGGWPQDLVSREEWVSITALDAVGYLAQIPVPSSAFEATLDAYFSTESIVPDVWLRSVGSGHLDRLTGKPVDATGALEEVDAPIAADGSVFGTTNRDGLSRTEDATLFPVQDPASSGTELLWCVWYRADLADGDTTSIDLAYLPTADPSTTTAAFRATASSTGITVNVGNQYGEQEGFYQSDWIDGDGDVFPLDGKPHLLTVWASLPTSGGGGAAASVRVWLDDQELALIAGSDNSSDASADTTFGLGGHPAVGAGRAAYRYQGVIDHALAWWDIGAWTVTPDEVVAAVYAARTSRVGDTMDERLSWLLEAVGWDLVGTFDTSGIVTQKAHEPGTSVLEYAQTVEATEQGRVWVDNDGRVQFSSRSWAWTDAVSTTVQETFTDDPTKQDAATGYPFEPEQSRIVDDDRRLVNVAKVNRKDGREQTVRADASVAVYGERNPANLDGLLFSQDRQSYAVAEWIIYTQSEPVPRVDELVFSPLHDEDLIPFACNVSHGYLVAVERGDTDIEAHVLDVGHRISLTSWTVSLVCDGTRAGLSWFTWDDGTGTVGSEWDGSDGWAF